MPTVTYTAIGSREQYGELLSLRRNVDRRVSADTVQQNTANLLPKYARLTNVSIELRWGCEGTIDGDSNLYINGVKIGDTCVGHNNNPTNTRSGLQGYFSSEQQYPGRPSGEIQVTLKGSSRIWYIFHLKVHYTYEAPKFVVSLSKSGEGTVSGAGTYDVGTNATITATPAKGYKFLKWSDGVTNATRAVTVANGSQTEYLTSLSYKAVFEKDYVLVSYDGNGATSGEYGHAFMQKDISDALETNWFEKKYAVQLHHNDGNDTVEALYSSADFLGWYTAAEGGERVGGSGDPFTPTGTTDLYAHWSAMPAVTLPTPTRDGYTFLGWYTAAEGGARVGGSGDPFTPTGTTDLYAHWSAMPAVTLPTPTRDGYTFLGWYTAAEGGARVGGSGDPFTPTGTTDLYAHWEEIIVPPEFLNVAITYGNVQVSITNKVPAGEGYLISVGLK